MSTRTFTINGQDSAGNPLTIQGSIVDGGTPTPPPVTNAVRMSGDHFTPATLTVPVGATVSFINDDNQPHWIRGAFDLGDQPAGATRYHVFPTAGTYPYVDAYHGARGTIEVTGATPPPPPPGPQLATVTIAPAQVKSGQTATLTARLTTVGAGGQDIRLTLSYSSGVSGPPTLVLPAAQIQGTVAVQTGPSFVGPATVTVTDGMVTRVASLNVVADTVPPSNRLNVRDLPYSAQGDGLTDDTAAIQWAINAATAGKTIYLPAGNYLLGSGLSVMTSGLSFVGDGDASILNHGLRAGIHVGGPGQVVQDFVIQALQFLGAPGKFNGDGNNAAHSLLLDGARNTTVRDVLFRGSAHCVYEVSHAVGVLVEECRMIGWGRVALGLGDGAIIRNNVMRQNYPDPTQRGVDYAVYPHNSCKNVLIEGNHISGCGAYALHYWAQADIGPGGPVVIRDNQISDCWEGMFIGSGDGNVGRLRGLTIQRNTWTGPVHGANVSLKNGDDVLFEDNVIASGVDPNTLLDKIGLAIGLWGPNDSNGLLTNCIVRNNKVSGFDIGIYCAPGSAGTGKFVGCTLGPGNQATGNRRNQIAETGPGLVVVP